MYFLKMIQCSESKKILFCLLQTYNALTEASILCELYWFTIIVVAVNNKAILIFCSRHYYRLPVEQT